MTFNKDIALTEINQEFENLSNLVLEQIDILNEIFESDMSDGIPDKTLKKLNKNEEKIDQFEIQIEEKIIRTIVLFQPVAVDLRQMFSVYRMVINLERVGDHVIRVVNHINETKDSDLLVKTTGMLKQMLKLATKMLNKALLSFANKDKSNALWAINKDDDLDNLYYKLLRKSITKSELPKELHAFFFSLTDIRSIISSFERIGDQATNIAEASLYAISGSDVRHQDTT